MATQVDALQNVSAPPEQSERRGSQSNAAPTLPDPPDVIVATSSEPADCGMLDALEHAFYQARGLMVRHITVGSGAALSLLLDGRADMALTHAPQLERRLADSGSLEALQSVMTSRYVVAFAEGSARDDSLEDGTCETVFSRIALGRVPFVSRADQSGTHLRELELWQAVGVRPQRPWYVEAPRAGARGVMRLALQRSAATLVDRLVLDSNDRFRIIEMRCPQADNEFSLLLPRRQTPGRPAARCFAEWLTAESARRIIGDFGATPV
jgi:tungstate transport system substrate-binding protein